MFKEFMLTLAVVFVLMYFYHSFMQRPLKAGALYMAFAAALLIGFSWDSPTEAWDALGSEIVGMCIELVILTFLWGKYVEDEQKRKEREKEKKLIKEFVSNYLDDFVESASKRYLLFFFNSPSQRILLKQLPYVSANQIKRVLENLDKLIQEKYFHRILDADKASNAYLYSEKNILEEKRDKILCRASHI